jgi:hypothetical protein
MAETNRELLPECRCLACHHKLNAGFVQSTGKVPKPNTMTICAYCGAVMMFADDLAVRGLNWDEMDALYNDPVALQALRELTQVIRMMPKMN